MEKKYYNHPVSVQTDIVLSSIVLAGSPVAGDGSGKLNTGISTDDQW